MKRIITVEQFMKKANESLEQYSDGLIHRGEFVRGLQEALQSITDWDLVDCKHTIESYGHTAQSFADMVKE